MAFDPFVKARLYLMALGKFRQDEGFRTLRELANWLRTERRQRGNEPFASYQAIARQVIRNSQSAANVQDAPTSVIRGGELGIDPSIVPGEETYRYRVVVEATSNTGRGRISTSFDINSDRVLTWSEIRDMTLSQWWNHWRTQYREQVNEGDWVQPDTQVYLISAGRRGTF